MEDEDEYVDIEMISTSDGEETYSYESYDECLPSLLLALPDDVIFYIASFLKPRDLMKFALVCCRFSDIASNNSLLWKRQFLKLFDRVQDGETIRREIEKHSSNPEQQTNSNSNESSMGKKKKTWKSLYFELEDIPLAINPKDQLPDITISIEDGMPMIKSSAPPGQSRCVIAAEPVPFWLMESKRNTWYFELIIGGSSKPALVSHSPIPPAVVIGLITSNFEKRHMPGWEVRSFGWHGDDGKIFDASSFGVDVPVDDRSKSTTFAAGDVVGLGVTRPYWDKSKVGGSPLIFRTKNGEFMGYLPSFLLQFYSSDSGCKLFPAIGLDIPGKITVNFDGCRGTPFKFDLSTLPTFPPPPPHSTLRRDTLTSFGFSSDEEDTESESEDDTYSWSGSSLTPADSEDDEDIGHSGDEFLSPIHTAQQPAMQVVSNQVNEHNQPRARN